MRIVVFCFCLIFAVPSYADDIATAYKEGKWDRVFEIAAEDDSYEAQLFAARAHLVLGSFVNRGAKAEENLEGARKHVTRALALNPDSLQARATMAGVVGLTAKKSRKAKGAKEAKRIIEENMDAYPESVIPRAALAGWYSETSASGFLGKVVLGSSRNKAKAAFDEAFKYDADHIPLLYEYGKFLSRGKKAERAQADEVFKQLAATETDQAAFEIFKEKAANIHVALLTGSKKTLKKALEENSPYPDFK